MTGRAKSVASAFGALVIAGACVAALIAGITARASVVMVVGVTTAIALFRRTPEQGAARRAWGGLSVATALAATAAVAAWPSAGRRGEVPASPAVSDAFVIAALVALTIVLWSTANRRQRRTDWLCGIDALVATAAVGLVLAVTVVPAIDERVTAGAETIASLTLVALLGLLSATFRFGSTGAVRSAAGRLVLAAVAAHIVAVAVERAVLVDLVGPDALVAVAALRLAAFAAMGAAAFLPSASDLAEREHAPFHALSPARIALLATSSASVPAVLVTATSSADRARDVAGAAGAAVISALLLARMVVVVRGARAHAAREAVLRDVGTRLGAAADLETVRETMLDTVERLLARDLRWCAVYTANDRDALRLDELRGADGRDELAIGLDRVVAKLDGVPSAVRRLHDRLGNEVAVVPALTQDAPRLVLVVASRRSVPPELDEPLAILTAQCALAADGVVQRDELLEKRSEARFHQLVRHASDAIVVIDADRRVRYQSPSVVRVLGFLPADLDGRLVDDCAHPDSHDHLTRFLGQLLYGPEGHVRSTDVRLVRADGSVIDAEVVGSNLQRNRDVGGIVLTVRDVTERRTLEDELRHQAFHDSLTGLPNRALFTDRVDHALERTRRVGATSPAVLFIDLDEFKIVNDSLGHGAGDELLTVVAERLRHCLREGDTAARFGGDEFAVLLEDVVDDEAVVDVAQRLLDALNEPVLLDDVEVRVGASVGVALRPTADSTCADLLRDADLAMYAAKSNGKGCIEVYDAARHERALGRPA